MQLEKIGAFMLMFLLCLLIVFLLFKPADKVYHFFDPTHRVNEATGKSEYYYEGIGGSYWREYK